MQQTAITIVGAGRIGAALASFAPPSALLVRRGEAIPDRGPGPIVVCTRNDDLAAVIAATPAARRADLVFVQNGMLLDWLEARGLGDATQALLYFAVPAVGATPQDGERTAATGRWAAWLAALLAAGDIACAVVDREAFRVAVVDKLLWTCVLGVVCERRGVAVDVAVTAWRADVEALTAELAAVCEASLDLVIPGGAAAAVERLVAYSLTIPGYRAAVKELRWRNGWVLGRRETPLHAAWLRELGHVPG